MDQDAAECLVGHRQGDGLAVLHLEIVGCGIHLEALCRLGLHGVVGTILQRDKDAAILAGGHGVDEFIVHLADLKSGVGDAFCSICLVDLDDLHASDGLVVEGQRLGVRGVDDDGLTLVSRIDSVSRDRLGLFDHDGAGDAGNHDLTIFIGLVEALAGQVAVGVVYIAALGVGQFKLHTGKRLMGHRVQFPDHKGSLCLIIKAQSLYLARLDLNGLGGGVQDVALQGLDLSRGDSSARLQIRDDDAAVLVGDVLAVGGAHHRTAGIGHQESHTLQGRGGALDILFNDQGGAGGVVEGQRLRVVGVDLDCLGLGSGVNGISGDGGCFSDHQGTYHSIDLDLAVFVRLIEAVAGDVAVFVGHILAGAGGHFERDPFQRLSRQGIPLIDDKGTGLGVGDDHRLGVATLPDDHIGGCLIHDVALGGLDFRNDICAGGQVGDVDLARGIGDENAILREGGVADDAVQPNLAAGGCRHSELRTKKRPTCGAVPFLDDQLTLGLVLEG